MTYYVLDTDHLSVLQRREEPAFTVLSKKLSAHSPDLIFVTIISFQEQFQGWMAFINRSMSASQLVAAYSKLENLIQSFSISQILRPEEPAPPIRNTELENCKHSTFAGCSFVDAECARF